MFLKWIFTEESTCASCFSTYFCRLVAKSLADPIVHCPPLNLHQLSTKEKRLVRLNNTNGLLFL